MTEPRYFGPNVEEFLLEWAAIANQIFGLHARLAFERMIEDRRQAEEARALELRDSHRSIECLESDLERVRGY